MEQWIDEMPEFSHLSLSEIAETIKVNSISAVNGEFHLWASTSIPIDHSIRLWIEMENGRILTNGASIEG